MGDTRGQYCTGARAQKGRGRRVMRPWLSSLPGEDFSDTPESEDISRQRPEQITPEVSRLA